MACLRSTCLQAPVGTSLAEGAGRYGYRSGHPTRGQETNGVIVRAAAKTPLLKNTSSWPYESVRRGDLEIEYVAKIVIVDDDPDVVGTLRECLVDEGHEVYTEANGLHALSTMLHVRPDLALSDVTMPDMGGVPLLTAMRDNAFLDEVPVIMMSAAPESKVADQCTGYVAFLQKPFTMKSLVEVVNWHLSEAAKPRTLRR